MLIVCMLVDVTENSLLMNWECRKFLKGTGFAANARTKKKKQRKDLLRNPSARRQPARRTTLLFPVAVVDQGSNYVYLTVCIAVASSILTFLAVVCHPMNLSRII